MKNVFVWTGWAVAAAAIGVASMLWVRGGDKTEPTESVALSQQKLQNDLEAAREALKDARADLAALQREHASLLKNQENPSAQLAVVEAGEDVEDTVSAEQPDEDATETEEEDLGKRVLRGQMSAMTDLAYGALFEDLALPDETRQVVSEWMIDAATQTRAAVVNAFQTGNTPAKEVRAAEDKALNQLRDNLKTVLTAEELEAWEAYEQDKDLHLYWNILEGQLSMLAPGLTQENRGVAKQVLAEELVAHIDALENSDEVYSLGNFNGAQSEAMQVSLERLAGALDEEQYAQVEGFVVTAEEALAAMGE